MSGYSTILKCERIKEHADKLGFMLCYPRHGGWGSSDERNDMVSCKPKDQDALPIYARDAQFFTGTIDEMTCFFLGIDWARNYDNMLRLSTEEKRERKEQDLRNKRIIEILTTGQDPSTVQT